MPHQHDTTFTLHGLDIDGRIVRANVFVLKLGQLISALRATDKIANGGHAHDFMLQDLRQGSAEVTVRARPRHTRQPLHSPISCFEDASMAVYNGDRGSVSRLSRVIVQKIHTLSTGANKKFAHAELSFPDETVLRIDDYLLHRAEDVVADPHGDQLDQLQSYRGSAFNTFDGILKEIDSRGVMLRGKLVLVPSASEIDCVMNKDRVPDARESFDKRVVLNGIARYDGRGGLPVRLDVHNIRAVKRSGDLAKWKGAFTFSHIGSDEDY